MDQPAPLARAIAPLERRLARRDESVIAEVVAAYGEAVLRDLRINHRRRLDHDERLSCMHDAIYSAFRKGKPYDPTIANAETYLKRLADYAARKYLERRSTLSRRLTDEATASARSHPSPVISRGRWTPEHVDRMVTALAKVNERGRIALLGWMRFGQAYYRRVLAEELGMGEDRVGQWFVRGKEQLRELLGPDFEMAD